MYQIRKIPAGQPASCFRSTCCKFFAESELGIPAGSAAPKFKTARVDRFYEIGTANMRASMVYFLRRGERLRK
jgi:hypothetical protein|tara:strand:+ start:413 stop:631 length:219 start_codon:yes stop_codon:yes gene_type:complete